MEKNIKKAIESYQCSGCVVGGDISCFKKNDFGLSCGAHCAGTFILGIGSFFLGLPKGFCRLGKFEKFQPLIFVKYEGSGAEYDFWNIPVWKHLNEKGHTLVRGLIPRRNEPFLHVFLEDCMDKINCQEVTQENIDSMD